MHQQENLKYDHKIINKYHAHKKQNKHSAYLKRTWRFPNNCKYALECSKAKDKRALHDEVVYLLFRRDGKLPSFHQSVHNLARPSLKSSARELLKAYIWIINTLMIPTRAQRAMPEAKFFRCTLFLGTQTSFPLSFLFHFFSSFVFAPRLQYAWKMLTDSCCHPACFKV